jgi:fimbrial chaperone protein
LPRVLVLLANACVAASAAAAGTISVSPIRIEMAPGDRSVVVTVRNDGDAPTLVQTELVAWGQAGGEDRLEPTADLLASPPIFSIAPRTEQIVRIAVRRPAEAGRERAYRLLVTEVPGAPQPGFAGAHFALKLSLPVFVHAGHAKAAPQIAWNGALNANGSLALTAVNSGTRHLQIRTLEVAGQGEALDGRFAGLWYILPGERRTVTIAPAAGRSFAADRIRIRADTDGGAMAADVALDRR